MVFFVGIDEMWWFKQPKLGSQPTKILDVTTKDAIDTVSDVCFLSMDNAVR